MRKPYEKDWRYSWARIWCDDVIRSMFSRITSEGKENVPTDGAVILAPNHCNTLMDALVVLQEWKEATLFGARADIFRKPAVNRILRFLRILPIPRVRDGAQAVLENRKTMEEVIECLDHGMKYCMFCEGTHRPMHSLLPLKKGIVRTALMANERLGASKPVYIVPVGLEYQDYYRNRTPVAIRYGKSINVSEFISSNSGMAKSKVYKTILDMLKERISSLITYLPDDETYSGRWSLTKISGKDKAMSADQETIMEADSFDRERLSRKISSWSLGKRMPWLRITAKTVAGLVLLPLVLFATVVSAPLWIPSAWLTNTIKDKAFVRTARFGVKFVLMPLLLIIWGVVFFCCLPFKFAAVAFILTLGSHTVFYEALERGRILLSDIRLQTMHAELDESYRRLYDKTNN